MNQSLKALAHVYMLYMVERVDHSALKSALLNLADNDNVEQYMKVILCDDQDRHCIITAAQGIFDEAGFSELSWIDLVRLYAVDVSKRIIQGELSCEDGSVKIFKATVKRSLPDDCHEFDTFIYAASEMPDRPRDKATFEKGVREEAERWAALDLPYAH